MVDKRLILNTLYSGAASEYCPLAYFDDLDITGVGNDGPGLHKLFNTVIPGGNPAINLGGGRVLISTVHPILACLTVHEAVHLVPVPAGRFQGTGATPLHVDGTIAPIRRRLFEGVTVSLGSRVTEVYPEWWGFGAEGVVAGVNQFDALQAAITAAAGKVLLLPAGLFDVGLDGSGNAVPLQLPGKGITIRGAGPGKTVLRMKGTRPALATSTGATGSIVLEGLTIKGTRTDMSGTQAERGVYFVNCAKVVLNSVYFTNLSYGAHLQQCSSPHVTGCRADDMFRLADGQEGSGFLFTLGCTDLVVERTAAANVGRHFLYISSGTRYARVTDCTSESSGSVGFSVYSMHTEATTMDVVFSNCEARNAAGFVSPRGFSCVENVQNVRYVNCTARDCDQYGFALEGNATAPRNGNPRNVSYTNCAVYGTGKGGASVGWWFMDARDVTIARGCAATDASTGVLVNASSLGPSAGTGGITINGRVDTAGTGVLVAGGQKTTDLTIGDVLMSAVNQRYSMAGVVPRAYDFPLPAFQFHATSIPASATNVALDAQAPGLTYYSCFTNSYAVRLVCRLTGPLTAGKVEVSLTKNGIIVPGFTATVAAQNDHVAVTFPLGGSPILTSEGVGLAYTATGVAPAPKLSLVCTLYTAPIAP